MKIQDVLLENLQPEDVRRARGDRPGMKDALGAGPWCGSAIGVSNPARTLGLANGPNPRLTEYGFLPKHNAVPLLLIPSGAQTLPVRITSLLRSYFDPSDSWCSYEPEEEDCAEPGFAVVFGGPRVVSDKALGELSSLIKQVDKLGLKNHVEFLGPKDLDSITNLAEETSFYLQTSKLEGMAMSVVEAMQLGVIPIVTPVGEIKNYCVNGMNSILISDNDSVISSVRDLLNNTNLYLDMRNNCIKKWQNHEIYSESVIRAAKKVLKINK